MIYVPPYISWQGYAVLYGSDSYHANDDAVAFLRAVGLSLVVPGTVSRVMVIDGGSGERVDLSQQEFDGKLRAETSLSFKVWNSRGVDMLCALRQGALWFEHYSIGYLQADAAVLVAELVKRFRANASAMNAQLLVVDWQARAEDFDWDAFWMGEVGFLGEPPELLGVPQHLAPMLGRPPPEVRVVELPGHVLWQRVPLE